MYRAFSTIQLICVPRHCAACFAGCDALHSQATNGSRHASVCVAGGGVGQNNIIVPTIITTAMTKTTVPTFTRSHY